jgi:hypothetical protein
MNNTPIIPVLLNDNTDLLTPSQYRYVSRRKAEKKDINPLILRKLYESDKEIYTNFHKNEDDETIVSIQSGKASIHRPNPLLDKKEEINEVSQDDNLDNVDDNSTLSSITMSLSTLPSIKNIKQSKINGECSYEDQMVNYRLHHKRKEVERFKNDYNSASADKQKELEQQIKDALEEIEAVDPILDSFASNIIQSQNIDENIEEEIIDEFDNINLNEPDTNSKIIQEETDVRSADKRYYDTLIDKFDERICWICNDNIKDIAVSFDCECAGRICLVECLKSYILYCEARNNFSCGYCKQTIDLYKREDEDQYKPFFEKNQTTFEWVELSSLQPCETCNEVKPFCPIKKMGFHKNYQGHRGGCCKRVQEIRRSSRLNN